MSYKKFEQSDIFYNTIITKPRYEMKIYSGRLYINNEHDSISLNNTNLSGSTNV